MGSFPKIKTGKSGIKEGPDLNHYLKQQCNSEKGGMGLEDKETHK